MKQFSTNVRESADERLDQLNERTDFKIKRKERPQPRTGHKDGQRADQFKRLVEACKHKELATIKSLLTDQPELLNMHDKQHRNLLHYAAILVADDDETNPRPVKSYAQADSSDCFNYLASRCESRLWFQVDQDGLTVLHLAVISCNSSLVDGILFNRKRAHDIESAPLVLALDKEHHSALHWAVITNNLECVRLLIEHSGVQLVHQADLNGATPLHYATQVSDYPKYRRQLRKMLQRATETSAGEARLNSPPSSRSSAGSSNSYQLESSEPTRSKATPSGTKFAPNYSNLDILDFLARLPGVNLECRDRDSRTPLLWAASSGNRQAILLLLRAGANYLSQDTNNLGPLHCAASHGFTDCLECLLLAPMTSSSRIQLINQVDHLNCTPLFYAVLSGNIDCVELLLERGAQKDWQDVKGRTAAHFGALRGQLNILKLLESRGANLWLANKQGDLPLHYAVKSGRQQVVAWLLEHSPYERPVNAINNTGRAPIHLAVLKNNANMVDFLIRRGANLNQLVKIRDKSNQASDGARLALVNAGPEHQAGSSSFHYETALDIAARLNQRHLVELLERNSAKSAAAVLATRQAAGTKSNTTRGNVRSLFDLQAAGVASPIGFETGGSSTEPPSLDQRPAQAVRVAWMPTLPRAMAEPMPQSSGDSANSSALSHSSLTSLNQGRTRQDQESEVHAGEQRDGQHQATGRRPFKGGMNYNNDRISASIKCKLYENNTINHQSFPPLSCPPEHAHRQLHKSAGSLPERSSGHQQEIVTNVNVYTSSPCARCFRPVGLEGDRHSTNEKCSDCNPQGDTTEKRRSAPAQTRAKASIRPSMKRLADGTISETSDSISEVGNSEESEHEDEAEMESGVNQFRLPALSSFEDSKRDHLVDVHQVSHAPTLRTYTQQLPVIMSAEEDRSTSGETGASQLTSKHANEEPRFDRSRRGRASAGRSSRLRDQVRSPVADYIHSNGLGPHQRSISEVRSQQVRQQQPDYTQPDYSQVRAKVDSHRNDSGLSSHFSDQLDGTSSLGGGGGRRSKSWSSSLAAQVDKEAPAGGAQFGQGRPRASVSERQREDEDQSRSCSRQTIIKTRRLSVDSDELATTIEKSIRRYKQESKLFEELQKLKRNQIRSGRANECLLVKRLVEHFRQEVLQEGFVGVDAYRGPYTYQAYELYLYDQLKKLSKFNAALLTGGRVPHKFTHQPHRGEPLLVAATGSESIVQGDAGLSQKEAHEFLEEDMKAEQELRRVLERGSMDSAAGNSSPTCDETIVIEPSGALQDIRVRKNEEEQQVRTGFEEEGRERDALGAIENRLADDEVKQRSDMQTDGPAEDLVRERLEKLVRNSSTGSSRRSSIEVEQEKTDKLPLWSNLSSSGHGDAKRAAAVDTGESERDQIEREANDLTAAILVDALGNVSRIGSPTGFRTDSKTNGADPAGEDEADQQAQPDRGRRRSVVNIGDKIEVIYHKVGIEIDTVAESEDQSDGSEGEREREQYQPMPRDPKEEQVETIEQSSAEEDQAKDEHAEANEGRDTMAETVVEESDEKVGSRSSLAAVTDLIPRKQASRLALRRASSPNDIGTVSKQLSGSRRSSSPVNQTADAVAARRVFNGFDLDSLREHRRRHQLASSDESSGRPSRARTGKSANRLRKPRSQPPAGPYKVYVPIELIRDRWNQVKRFERRRKNEVRLNERSQLESGEAETESRSLKVAEEMAHARSQPNLALESRGEAKEIVDTAPDSCSNFILIYEVNKPARGADSQQVDNRQADEPKPTSAGETSGKRIIWCQKRMTRIVDVRTLKRTLSLPDSLMYSNELLKRFNLLKL